MALLTTGREAIKFNELDSIHNLLSHLYGPNQHQIMVNSKLVSSSQELFQSVTPDNDVISLMFSFLRQQLHRYKDGGCFVGLLATGIIKRYLKETDGQFSVRVLQGVNETVLEFCIREVQSLLSWKCNIGRFKDVGRLIHSVLFTKLKLKTKEVDHLCLLFARVFTIENQWDNCHVIKIVAGGNDIIDSKLEDGLLLRLEKYSMLQQKMCNVKVVIFSVSIALDSEELFGTSPTVHIETSSCIHQLKDDILDNNLLEVVCKSLLAGNVNIVICQKVIHPRVKAFLKDHNIAWVDRLGGAIMPMLIRICACQPINNLKQSNIDGGFVGHISTMERLTIGGSFYLKLLHKDMCNLNTLILCSSHEDVCNALETCYEQVLVTLDTVSRSERVVSGGGCTVTQLVKILITKYEHNYQNHHITVYVGALLKVCQGLGRDSALHHKTDSKHNHHWIDESVTCCCGMITKTSEMEFIDFMEFQNLKKPLKPKDSVILNPGFEALSSNFETSCRGAVAVVESEEIFLHNFKTAFQLATMVLRIGSKVVSTTSITTS